MESALPLRPYNFDGGTYEAASQQAKYRPSHTSCTIPGVSAATELMGR